MVGLVVVSHSFKIAEGLLELAREMAGPEVRMAATGGLDLPGRPLGTDAVAVMHAIQQADSPGGVVVLADLGSAILNAEMAIEMLEPDLRARVRVCAAPLVEGTIAAAAVARLGSSIDQVALEAQRALGPKEAQLGAPAATLQTLGPTDTASGASIRVVIPNRLGWHARPASRIVALAGRYRATISVRNLTTGLGPVSASSMNDVLLLGARQHHEVEFHADGDEHQAALEAIADLAANHFGDDDSVPAASEAIPTRPADTVPEGAWRGVAASPGLAIGTASLVQPSRTIDDASGSGSAEPGWAQVEQAIAQTMSDLRTKGEETLRRAGASVAAIFEAERALLSDPALLETARYLTSTRGLVPAAALEAAAEHIATRIESASDDYIRGSAADVRHVVRQVLDCLHGSSSRTPEHASAATDVILVRDEFSPTDVVSAGTGVIALCAARGAATGHAAILARALGIPAVFGVGDHVLNVPDGDIVAVDGDRGHVWHEPSAAVVAEIAARMAQDQARERAARAASAEPAITRDGRRIEVAANVGNAVDAAAGLAAGAEGVGLFRTELIFVGRQTAPDEDEQYAAYRDVARAMEGRPVIIRTLDVGGDKPLSYLRQAREDNPFLGLRGLRISLAEPDLFITQLRAIARAAADHPIRVMFPMVSTLEEWRRARTLWHEHAAPLARRPVPLGIMIEVPAAALSVRSFASEADFFSIGTNDLTQYVFAAERGNADVAALNDAWHPAVLRLIHEVCEAAHAEGRWVGVCGELAADPSATPLLIGLGVDELSVSAPAVARVKASVRALDSARARAVAQRLLGAGDGADVRARIGDASG